MATRKEVKVALDGTGTYRTVQEAIDEIPFSNTQRVVIRIAPGVYKQPIYVPKSKNLITFAGLDAHRTILTWFNTATSIQHHQAERVIGIGTFGCGSVIVEGEDFIAENITFENSAPKGSGQAVAIRITGDRCAFYGCRFVGWQDTAYLHYGRQYFRDCYIEGSVDFIFGNATALLEYCQIFCKSQGFITAQKRITATETTGYVFLRILRILEETLDIRSTRGTPEYMCTTETFLSLFPRCVILGTGETKPYMCLGRPWGPCSRVVFAHTWMDGCITLAGWNNWSNRENEKTACYYEYNCSGPGSDTSKRVHWAQTLSSSSAAPFLSTSFIDPQRSWLNVAGTGSVPAIPVPLSA